MYCRNVCVVGNNERRRRWIYARSARSRVFPASSSRLMAFPLRNRDGLANLAGNRLISWILIHQTSVYPRDSTLVNYGYLMARDCCSLSLLELAPSWKSRKRANPVRCNHAPDVPGASARLCRDREEKDLWRSSMLYPSWPSLLGFFVEHDAERREIFNRLSIFLRLLDSRDSRD